MPARIYAIANQKGGVGKTTTAVNLAACLAEAGERCLIVDLDPQANATSGLGLRANGHSTVDLLDGTPLRELVDPAPIANLDVVPAKAELAAATVHLSALEGGERYLADALCNEATQPYRFAASCRRASASIVTASGGTEATSQNATSGLVEARSAQTRSHRPGRSERAIGPCTEKTIVGRSVVAIGV